jgi:peptide/nickel transport system ATP-binding protein
MGAKVPPRRTVVQRRRATDAAGRYRPRRAVPGGDADRHRLGRTTGAGAMTEPLLAAHGLRRSYRARPGASDRVRALDGVDLSVEAGGTLGVVGSTGAGKSTLVRLLLALEPPDEGTVSFDGHTISHLPEARIRPLRRRFQAVFQDPIASLDPRLRVGTIVSEPLAAFGIGAGDDRRTRVAELLESVGLDRDAARRYPGAFSGGERQRIAIARAVAPEPELLILDEPVSFLDVAVKAQIIELISELRRRYGLTLVVVSHDLRVVREVTDRVQVLYRGVVVEAGATAEVLSSPAHPHTAALLAAEPVPEPGWKPPESEKPAAERSWPRSACRFADRCPRATDACTAEPPLEALGDGREVRCHHPIE